MDLEDHVCVFGRSSAGKTYWWRETVWKQSKKRVVFFNAQREAGFGREVTKWDPRLLRPERARVNLCPPLLNPHEDWNDEARSMLGNVFADMIRIGDKVTKGRVDRMAGTMILGVDEAHLASPNKSNDDPLQRVATNGNRFTVKGHFITQRPALLHQTPKSQAPVHVLFELDDYEAPYLEKYGVPDDVRQWISSAPRRFAVRRGKTWTNYRPL